MITYVGEHHSRRAVALGAQWLLQFELWFLAIAVGAWIVNTNLFRNDIPSVGKATFAFAFLGSLSATVLNTFWQEECSAK